MTAYKAVKVTKAASTAKKTTVVAKVVTKKPKPLTTIVKTLAKSAKPKNVKKQSAALKKVTKKTKNIGCFTKGTKVSTKNGFKAIDQIRVGDHVWSENPETNEKALKKVKKIFVREKDSIIRLSINGETIETTDEHPFYLEGYGFVSAKSLAVGDYVRTQDGISKVEEVEKVQLDTPINVYNFEVEDYHSYYVSEAKVLVHNTCAATVKNTAKASNNTSNNIVYRALNSQDKQTFAAGKGIQAKNPNGSWDLKQHIINGSSKASWKHDPYISTTTDIKVAKAFNKEGSNLGIVAIDLNKVPGLKQKGYEIFPRTNGAESIAYHYSFWQQEVSIYRHIPQNAIVKYIK